MTTTDEARERAAILRDARAIVACGLARGWISITPAADISLNTILSRMYSGRDPAAPRQNTRRGLSTKAPGYWRDYSRARRAGL